LGKGRVAITSTKARKEVAVFDDVMLLQLMGAIEALEKAMASTALGRKERVLRLLADVEDNLDELARLCEDPSLREIVAQYFKALEAGMAKLAVAAGMVAPEPEVGP